MGEDDSAQTRPGASHLPGEGLEREYQAIVRAQLARLGVPAEAVEVEVRPAGSTAAGLDIYFAMVRLTSWHARTSLRLLVALPLLELKTRHVLETSWLSDVSHFGGLWVHASAAVRGADVIADIREAVTQLGLGAEAARPGAAPRDGWSASMHAALQDPERGTTR